MTKGPDKFNLVDLINKNFFWHFDSIDITYRIQKLF